ncbi:ubl carboxyl-terminal hydrolase 18-like [Heterodontus francisci]|uniref:ubl carboxyl-terminal hydrolase 18-like n=1 Tax=Heterodontus francisci TaxID=7792 RepID=UPI00355C7DE8
MRPGQTRATLSSAIQVSVNQAASPGSRNRSSSMAQDLPEYGHFGDTETGQVSAEIMSHFQPPEPWLKLSAHTEEGITPERKLNRDAMLHSPGIATQAHVPYFCNHEQNSVDQVCEERPPTRYSKNQRFVGLTNTSNNCCVNALLQTLFMTPEYKILLLKCRQKGALIKANNHIPYHLDKVFQHLQDNTQRTIFPLKFIRCLILNHINMGIQLDAEETFRSLFSLLQDQLKETEFISDINNLHMLTTEEYTKCLECQHEFKQVGYMLTIPLSLYNPSSGKPYESVEKSLDAFFELQHLDDANMWYCDQCGEKTAAVQGNKVLSCPQILCLQLKRFDFASNLGTTVKNYDFMAFPESLHFEKFIEKHHSQMSKWQYNLLSVIVHMGSTSFGHYYAHIRRFPEMDWYCFNDKNVMNVTWEDVKMTFGSSPSSSTHQNEFQMHGTAYLLFYKRME